MFTSVIKTSNQPVCYVIAQKFDVCHILAADLALQENIQNIPVKKLLPFWRSLVIVTDCECIYETNWCEIYQLRVYWFCAPIEDSEQLNPWQPIDMIHRSPCTADKFAEEYDRHGDSYTQDATIGSLKDVFNNVQTQVEYYYWLSAKRILYRFYQTVISV